MIKIKHVFNESEKWKEHYKYNIFSECIRTESITNESTNFKSDLM